MITQATVWDIPDWKSPLTVGGLLKQGFVGTYGYFPACTSFQALACDKGGRLFIDTEQALRHTGNGIALDWAVQVGSFSAGYCGPGIAVHIPAASVNYIERSVDNKSTYREVNRVLTAPLTPEEWNLLAGVHRSLVDRTPRAGQHNPTPPTGMPTTPEAIAQLMAQVQEKRDARD